MLSSDENLYGFHDKLKLFHLIRSNFMQFPLLNNSRSTSIKTAAAVREKENEGEVTFNIIIQFFPLIAQHDCVLLVVTKSQLLSSVLLLLHSCHH